MNPQQRIRIMLELLGGPEYSAQVKAAATETTKLGAATARTGTLMADSSKKTFLQTQALYTLRRYSFYATLAITGVIAELGRLGFEYLNAMNTSRVALQPVFSSTQALNAELGSLYTIAALSPFLFKDTVVAFRTLYSSFQPLGWSVAFTNKTLNAMINALSYMGRFSPGAINRVSVQLQHLANIGRPTGQVLLALARDGLPVYPALRKELGLTGTSLENIAKSGYTAQQVIDALNKYIMTTPGYMGAAMRMANRTLTGSWEQFRDLLSQAAGRGEAGLFGGLRNTLASINNQIAPLLKHNKPISLYDIANAMDNALTPGTHLLINSFVTLHATLTTLFIEFGLLFKGISLVLSPLDYLASLFGINHFAAQALGIVLGTVATLWLINKTRIMLTTEALALNRAVQIALNRTIGIDGVAALIKGAFGLKAYAFATEEVFVGLGRADAAAGIWNEEQYVNNGLIAKTIRGMVVLASATWGMVTALWASVTAWTAEKWAAIEGWAAALGPITLIVAGIAAIVAGLILVIKYWKQFKELAVHTLINSPSGDLGSSGYNKHSSAATKVGQHLGFLGHIPGFEWIAKHWHPSFASGGTMSQSGTALVGEHGPELVYLPGGSKVIPNHSLPGSMTGTNAFILNITVIPQPINLDGVKLTEVVSTVVTDQEARM